MSDISADGVRIQKRPETPPEWETLHKWLLRVCLVFFVWLVVEGALLVPYLIARYGWW